MSWGGHIDADVGWSTDWRSADRDAMMVRVWSVSTGLSIERRVEGAAFAVGRLREAIVGMARELRGLIEARPNPFPEGRHDRGWPKPPLVFSRSGDEYFWRALAMMRWTER